MIRKVHQLWNEEKAVSPVIGVILMVAVTVVLAAVIGAFVLGLGDSTGEPAPNANVDFDYTASTGEVIVSHDGGETDNEAVLAESLSSGDGIATVSNVDSDDELGFEWNSPDGSNSQTLGSFQAP